jgi:hypothetical protein
MRVTWAGMLGMAAALAVSGVAAAADTNKPDDRRVCRSERNTGSRIPTSECHSRSEWVEIDAARAKQAEQFQRNMNNPAADRGFSTSPMAR